MICFVYCIKRANTLVPSENKAIQGYDANSFVEDNC